MNFDPKHEATKAALRKMFREDGHFSICTIDNLCKLNAVVPDPEVYAAMRALHCVNYRDMGPHLPQWLIDRSLEMFGAPALGVAAIEDMRPPVTDATWFDVKPQPEPVRRTLMQRLLGQ